MQPQPPLPASSLAPSQALLHLTPDLFPLLIFSPRILVVPRPLFLPLLPSLLLSRTLLNNVLMALLPHFRAHKICILVLGHSLQLPVWAGLFGGVNVHRLPIHALPVRSAFVVGKGVKERLAEDIVVIGVYVIE